MSIRLSVEKMIEMYVKNVNNNHIRERIENWSIASGYAEPGYSDPECPEIVVVLGNFNLPDEIKIPKHSPFISPIKNPIIELQKKIEQLGRVDFEWNDEWAICSECMRAVRIQSDSYGWTPHFVVLNENRICIDCLKKNDNIMDDFIQDIKNKSNKRVVRYWGIDLKKYGFKQIPGNCFETGLHEHQNADPVVVLKYLRNKGYDVIFSITDKSQFDVNWNVWVSREENISQEELEQLEKDLLDKKNVDGFSPSETAKRALKGV